MPLKVNGSTVPWSVVTSLVVAMFWLAGLSFQVRANDEEIKKQATTTERLAKIETTLNRNKEDIDDIKEAQKRQSDKLDRILEKLSDKKDD